MAGELQTTEDPKIIAISERFTKLLIILGISKDLGKSDDELLKSVNSMLNAVKNGSSNGHAVVEFLRVESYKFNEDALRNNPPAEELVGLAKDFMSNFVINENESTVTISGELYGFHRTEIVSLEQPSINLINNINHSLSDAELRLEQGVELIVTEHQLINTLTEAVNQAKRGGFYPDNQNPYLNDDNYLTYEAFALLLSDDFFEIYGNASDVKETIETYFNSPEGISQANTLTQSIIPVEFDDGDRFALSSDNIVEFFHQAIDAKEQQLELGVGIATPTADVPVATATPTTDLQQTGEPTTTPQVNNGGASFDISNFSRQEQKDWFANQVGLLLKHSELSGVHGKHPNQGIFDIANDIYKQIESFKGSRWYPDVYDRFDFFEQSLDFIEVIKSDASLTPNQRVDYLLNGGYSGHEYPGIGAAIEQYEYGHLWSEKVIELSDASKQYLGELETFSSRLSQLNTVENEIAQAFGSNHVDDMSSQDTEHEFGEAAPVVASDIERGKSNGIVYTHSS